MCPKLSHKFLYTLQNQHPILDTSSSQESQGFRAMLVSRRAKQEQLRTNNRDEDKSKPTWQNSDVQLYCEVDPMQQKMKAVYFILFFRKERRIVERMEY